MTVLGYDLNENTNSTWDLHARDQDHVSLQWRHARRASWLPDLRGALTKRDSFFLIDRTFT